MSLEMVDFKHLPEEAIKNNIFFAYDHPLLWQPSLSVEVQPGIFLGDYACTKRTRNTQEQPWLKEHGITHIVTIMEEWPYTELEFSKQYRHLILTEPFFQNAKPGQRTKSSISFSLKTLRKVIWFIEEAKKRGGRILIHSLFGSVRALLVLLIYLSTALTFDLAATHLSKCTKISLSPHLRLQAQQLYAELAMD